MFKPKKEDPVRVAAWPSFSEPGKMVLYATEKKNPTNAAIATLPLPKGTNVALANAGWDKLMELKAEVRGRIRAAAR